MKYPEDDPLLFYMKNRRYPKQKKYIRHRSVLYLQNFLFLSSALPFGSYDFHTLLILSKITP